MVNIRGARALTISIALVCAWATFGAAAASAAPTTIGSTFVPGSGTCIPGGVAFQTETTPTGGYVVPSAGVISSWSFQAGNEPPAHLKLVVARKTAVATEFLIVGTSANESVVSGSLNTYSTSIPVQAGDILGERSEAVITDQCGASEPANTVNFAAGTNPSAGEVVGAPSTTTLLLDLAATINEPPTASAGADQEVPSAASVALSGSASSDPDGDTLTYAWKQTAGAAVALVGPTTAKPSFTAPTGPVSLSFELEACDPSSECSNDSVTVAVKAPILQPSPATPNTAPNTSLKSTKIAQRKVTFSFASTQTGSTFLCKLDKKAFAGCKSPKAYRNLSPGKHKFQVEARDAKGQLDPSPVVKSFRIKG